MDKVVVFLLFCGVAHLGHTIDECNEGSKECSPSEGLLVVNQLVVSLGTVLNFGWGEAWRYICAQYSFSPLCYSVAICPTVLLYNVKLRFWSSNFSLLHTNFFPSFIRLPAFFGRGVDT